MELLPGASLGPYKILEEIGSGHMGKVYLAQDERLDRRVALKTLTGSTGAEAERRLRKEARAIARLNNPNIAALYDVCEYDGVSLLVMEYADGESLSDLVTAEIGVDRTIDIGLQLTDALAYAHREGIIHRDVKPANVKLTRDGKVKLLDLGIARVSLSDPGATTSNMADTTAAAGTPAYMAPERLHGHPADTRTDVYSVGVLLFELLTGGRPYASTDMLALRVALGGSRTPRARAINPKVSRTLDDVVAKAMSRDPKTRYSSAADLHNDLLRARDSSSRRVVPIVRPQSRLGWTVVLGLAAIVAAIVWVVMRPAPVAPVPKTLAVLPIINDSPSQPDLDELGSLLQSVIARNLAALPGIKIVSAGSMNAMDTVASGHTAPSPGYIASISLGHATEGAAADIDVRRLGKSIFSKRVVGNELTVLRDATDEIASALEQTYLLGRPLSEPDRARLRQLPTQDGAALKSYLDGRSTLDTAEDATSAENAAAAFLNAVKHDSKFSFALAGLSQAYSLFNKHAAPVPDRARKAAQDALDLDLTCDQAHLAMALAIVDSDKNNAIAEARKAVARTPDSDDAYRILGQVQVDPSQPDAGFAELRKATVLRPQHWINWYQLGRSLLIVHMYQEAIEPLEKMRENVRNFESVYVNLGFAHTALGNLEQAINYLVHAQQLRQNDHSVFNNLATAYFWHKDYAQAEANYQEAIRWDRDNPKLYMNLGDVYGARNRPGEAHKAYEKCVTLVDAKLPERTDDNEAIAAKCMAKLGDVKAAEARARARLTEGENPEVLYKLAVVYTLAGNRAEALNRLERAVAHRYSRFFVSHDPDLMPLHNEPRFQALIAPPPGR